MATNNDERLEPYDPPSWAAGLPIVPRWKVKLAMTPTPIHRWYLPGIPDDVEVYIKRDDMTGSVLSGNKVRKLEFLLADALAKGCRHVITTGGLQSNHCRATAIAARQLGLKPHLLISWCDAEKPDDLGCRGNMFLDRLVNADLYVVPTDKMSWEVAPIWSKALAENIWKETGESSYPIVVGGSSDYGAYAYIDVLNELLDQDAASRFDDVIVTAGSVGTVEGLTMANHLSGAGFRIHCVSVYRDSNYVYSKTNQTLRNFQLSDVESQDILDVIEARELDCEQPTQDEMDFILNVAAKTGVILDPVYTSKTAMGLVHELNHNRGRFKGNRILFIHTGGIFRMFDGQLNETLVPQTNKNVKFWSDMDSPPVKYTP